MTTSSDGMEKVGLRGPDQEFEPVVGYLTRARHQWEYVDPTYEDVFPEDANRPRTPTR